VDYGRIFNEALKKLHQEGRYRVFADIRRDRGAFPRAELFVVLTPACTSRTYSLSFNGTSIHRIPSPQF
jgi:hypothetical protein